MSFLRWCTMLSVMTLLLSGSLGDTSIPRPTFILADTLQPPGPPIVTATSAPLATEIERQGRLRGPFPKLRGRPPLRIHQPRALFQPPPPLPPQPLFIQHDDSSIELEVNPELKKVLKDISMADLPLAGEGENQLPGFFAPEFNNRFTPDENAPIIPVTSTTPRIPITQQATTELSNQLPLADSEEPRPLFPPFGPEQFPPFHIEQTTSIAPVIPPENSNQQFSSLVPDTLRSIFPSFGEVHFGSQFPPFSPNPTSPPTLENLNTGVTEPFTPSSGQTINHELHNPINQGFQDQGSLELSNEFPPRLNNNHALNEEEFFHPHHISGLRPPTGNPSQGVIHSTGQNRRPPKPVRKPQPNGALRKPNKNQGHFVHNNGRIPRHLQRRPQQHPPRGLGSNNARRPIDHHRQRVRATPSVRFRPVGRRPGRLPRPQPWHQIHQ